MKSWFQLATSICIFVPAVCFVANAYGAVGIPMAEPTASALKSIELQLDINRFLIAVIGAALAYLLTHGKYIVAIFKKQCACLQKGSFAICFLSLTISALFLLWDQFTIVNQLKSGFVSSEDLLPQLLYFTTLGVGLLTFCICSSLIWITQHDSNT